MAGQIVETKITDFTGGITNDPRDTRAGVCRMCTNFDIMTDSRRMLPYFSSVSGDSAASTSQKQNFCVGLWTASNPDVWRLFSLGRQSAQDRAEVLMKDLAANGNDDLADDTWLTPTANQSASGAARYELFHYYHKTGKIYGARANQYIWEFTPDGSTAWADSKYDATSITNLTQAITHSADDIMYFGVDNKIIKNDNGTFSVGLTLSTKHYVTSVEERGQYLAISVAHVSGTGQSRVFLWDRNSSLTTIAANIDWGEGVVKVIGEVQGELVGISVCTDATRLTKRIIFKRYAGAGLAVKIGELTCSTATLFLAKQKKDDRLYFMLSATINGAVREGVWSVGFVNGRFSLAHESTPDNDTALGNGVLKNFFFVGDFLFTSYTTNASAYALSKTNTSQNYSATSIWESTIFNAGDVSLKKDLIGISVGAEPLPSGGQIVVKYKTNAETSYTTILTEATDDSLSDSAVNIESSGATLPKDYKEICFQILSTGGAVITGFSFKEQITGKRAYT